FRGGSTTAAGRTGATVVGRTGGGGSGRRSRGINPSSGTAEQVVGGAGASVGVFLPAVRAESGSARLADAGVDAPPAPHPVGEGPLSKQDCNTVRDAGGRSTCVVRKRSRTS